MRLVILGTGGYGRTIRDLAIQSEKYDEIIHLDDKDSKASGLCAEYNKYIDKNTEFYPAFGNNELRMYWLREFFDNNIPVCSFIHKTAYVAPSAKIGKGTIVLPHASVGTDAVIGDGCIINMNSVVDHDCLLENGIHIGSGAVVRSGTIIKANTKIAEGSTAGN